MYQEGFRTISIKELSIVLSVWLVKALSLSAQAGYERSNFVGNLPLPSSSVVSEILRCQRIEMESPSKSSPNSHRVRGFLPSIKPSYLSLILVLVCATNLMRNESTNDRLLTLEKQMKILTASHESRVETRLSSNYDEVSAEPFANSLRAVRKTAESLEKKPYFPSGKNHSSSDKS